MIEKLADFSAIEQLGGALWGTSDARGAAIFVGAGFSRNAILPSASSPEPPLWFHFTKEMSKRLYPKGGAPTDPLRLAEEYRTVLGQPALESLIFDLIRDGEWISSGGKRTIPRLEQLGGGALSFGSANSMKGT